MSAVKYYAVETGAFIKKWYLSLPLGSAVTVTVCLVAETIDAIQGFNDFADLGICPPSFVRHPLPGLHHLITAPLYHQTLFTMFFNLLFFPPLNKMLETQRGTLHALNFFLSMSLVATSLYVILIMPVYAIFGGTHCMGGLGSIMYALATVEANEKAGIFKTRRVFGVPLPGAIYPWLLLVLSWLFFGSPFFYNLSGILAGVLYHVGGLKFLFLPDRAWTYLERNPPLQWITSWKAFIETPSSISLPTEASASDG